MAAVSRGNRLAGHFVFSASSASCLPTVVWPWEMAFFWHSLSLEQIQLLFPFDCRGSYIFSVPGMLANTVLWATVSTAASPALQGSVEVVRQFPTWCWGQLDLASSQPWPASSRKWRCSLTEQAENGGVVEFLAPFWVHHGSLWLSCLLLRAHGEILDLGKKEN